LIKEGSRAEIFERLPQLEMLKSADLAITRVGSNTVRECIATGTPILAFAGHYDQPGNAARMHFHGLGLRASRFHRAETILRLALNILEDNNYRRRVDEMRSTLVRSEVALLDDALREVALDDKGVRDALLQPYEG
jgi:UDP:flavonoid glycosyltransferase YjiC (YdhE family)